MNADHRHNKYTTSRQSSNPIHFDQHSTDQLLKQLKISLKDVEAIIQKSKQSLGLKSSNHQLRSSLPREGSSFNFNVSIEADQSSIKDELTYSLSPQTDSRFKNIQTIKTVSNRTSKSLYKKLLFQENKQIQQMQSNQIFAPITEQKANTSAEKEKSKQINIKIQTYQKRMNDNKPKNESFARGRLNDLQLDICTSDEPDEEQQFRYQQEYCIIINKGNKKEQDDRQDRQDRQEDEGQTLKKQNYFQHQKTKNSEASEQNSIIYKKQDSNPHQRYEVDNKLQLNQIEEKQDYKSKKNTLSSQICKNPKNSNQKISNSQKNTSDHKNNDQINRNMTEHRKNYSNKIPKVAQFIINQSSLANTCTKNQLQNILILNSNSKKSKNNNNLQKLMKSQKVMKNSKQIIILAGKKSAQKKNRSKGSHMENKQKKLQTKSPMKSPKKSPPKSPIRSIYNSKRSDGESPTVSKWKPNYIQKYINVLAYKKQQKQKQRSSCKKSIQEDKSISNQRAFLQRYSHPLKSHQKRKSATLQIHQHTNQYTQQCNKQLFMSLMKQQCYVRRFLNETQLHYIFQQFFHKKVPRYLWEQRVIQKIFKKIHQSDEII